jgi:molecular chaperone HtpG
MAKVTFGKHILENLTTAMYTDSRIMFREYVQNSCDAIREAVNAGIILRDTTRINICINKCTRGIEISDNGTGVPRAKFERVLSDIANSDKERGGDMGFRGIGRLCGLAYCNQLKFISTAYGETDICTMTWDAGKMREMLEDSKKYSVEEVLNVIKHVDVQDNAADTIEHYFKVVLSDIRRESDSLLDVADIRGYLSFVAPVPYSIKFLYYSQIYDHAKKLGESIDEYKIYINDEQVFKNYVPRVYTSKGMDDIKSLEFHDFYDADHQLLAWMWFGISAFSGSIADDNRNLHRGLRLRKANIQIGNDNVLRELHKEPRGNGYFIGELFAIHRDLTPNARRDYFNENSVSEKFECEVKTYFIQTLYKLYYEASNTRSAYEDVEKFHKADAEFKAKAAGGFSGSVERIQAEIDLEKKQEAAEKARKKIDRYEQETHEINPLTRRIREIIRDAVTQKEESHSKIENASVPDEENDHQGGKPKYMTDELSSYTKETRKVVSRIYDLKSR